ncbi:MAG: glycosyltransferase [Candidatus Binatia bacterium]
MKKILLGCYGVPGRGGASTVLYLLFERMQRDGLDVAYVNLIEEPDEVFCRYLFGAGFSNPRSLKNVHTCILHEPLWRAHAALAELIDALAPDLLLGFSFIAARLLELAAPRRPVVFMTAGSRQVQHLIETGALRDFLGFRQSVTRGVTFPVPPENHERQAAEAADLIIVHSPLVKFAFEHFFPAQAGKIYANIISVADFIYAEAEQFAAYNRPFAQRDIDLIFVASSWNRLEKNYALVQKIIARCAGLQVHIVGEVEQPRPAAHYHGAIRRREDIYALLGRSKTLLCPSLVDAAPGVLFEASAMGCNVIASPNCGNWQLCNAQLLAECCSSDVFVSKIPLSLASVYEDNREHFRGGYADLVETLSVCGS